MALFQQSVLKKHLSDLPKDQLSKAWNLFRTHFHDPVKQQNIRNAKEEQYQEGFMRELFVDVLGYTLNPSPGFNLTTEYKNEKDSKKADGAILKADAVTAIIELKGTDTTDLGKVETQAFSYKNNQKGCTYVITSNFEKLRFYINDAVEHLEFNLFTLTEKEFAVLYCCLQANSLLADVALKMKQASVTEEESVTKKLYADYSGFKRKLFQSSVALNPQYDKLTLFKKTQKLLDRFLFILFAEDRLLLPPNSVREILKQWEQLKELDNYVPLYDRFKKYFGYLNTGYQGREYEIFAYNGGLFAPDEILDTIQIEDGLLYDATKQLSQYDFETEVDVNILGHIFEHSLNEIEEVERELTTTVTPRNEGSADNPVIPTQEGSAELSTKAKTSKRKKDGVFYTPRYITKYIVENTIGALCTAKKEELEITDDAFTPQKRKDNTKKLQQKLETYRQWLLQLTICDPACGSGAFLNQALEFLIAEHRYVDTLTAKLFGDTMVLSDVENSILENNLFGVDINEEAVEIARLSLWLRTARKGRKLNNLNNNIKAGNSLIDDAAVAGDRAFNWQQEFPEIFAKGGFDVVIGNPPYVSVKEIDGKQKAYLLNEYNVAQGQFDLYGLFYEKGFKLLKEGQLLSYISSNTFLSNKDFKNFRKYFLENSSIIEIINLGETVFEDANLDVAIFSFKRLKQPQSIKICKSRLDFDSNHFTTILQEDFLKQETNYEYRITISDSDSKLINKILKNKIRLGDILDLPRGIEIGGNSNLIKKEKLQDYEKVLAGRDIDRYFVTEVENYIKFENNKSVFKDKFIYSQEKILIQRIRNLSLERRIVAALDKSGMLATNTLRIGNLKNTDYRLRYILGLINSKLINFLFKRIFFNKDIYAYQLEQIPIVKTDSTSQSRISELVDKIIKAKNDLNETLVKVQNLIKIKDKKLKLTNRLILWHHLSFEDFLKELEKQKIKLSLSEQSEWMQYFEAEKAKANQLQQQIDATDKEIDQMVYALYELTEEEIKIVEGD